MSSPGGAPAKRVDKVGKSSDGDGERRRREEHTVKLRKEKKEEQLAKQRKGLDGLAVAAAGEFGFGAFAAAPAGGFGASSPAEPRPTADQIPMFAQALKASLNPNELLEITMQFRKLLSIERLPPIEAVIASGVVPRIVQLLTLDAHPRLQFEACWTLTNIASGTSANTHEVVNAGAVPSFVRLLSSQSEDVREQAVWALGNIAGDGVPTRNAVVAANIIPPLLACITPHAKLSLLKNATWTLSNLCRGKPPPALPVTRQLLPKLSELITSDEKDVQQDALWALSYVSDGDEDRLWAFLESGALPRIVQLLSSPHMEVVTPALRTIGNIVTGDDLLTQAVLNEGVLHAVLSLMNNFRRTVRKEACWMVSNVCAGTPGQIQMVFDCNLFPALIHQLTQGEPDVQREACWALSNATTGGTQQHIYDLVRLGVVAPLKKLLEAPTGDPRVQVVALEGLTNILLKALPPGVPESADANYYLNVMEQAGVPDVVAAASDTSNEQLYRAAENFMARFFPNFNNDANDDNGEGDEGYGYNPAEEGANGGGWNTGAWSEN